jgi:hypothetical protein
MKENDPLNSVLREWDAPKPPPAMDARVLAAYRAGYRPGHRPSPWWRFCPARVSIPVPVLAALVVILTAFWFQFRVQPPVVQPGRVAPPGEGYLTRMEAAGFAQPEAPKPLTVSFDGGPSLELHTESSAGKSPLSTAGSVEVGAGHDAHRFVVDREDKVIFGYYIEVLKANRSTVRRSARRAGIYARRGQKGAGIFPLSQRCASSHGSSWVTRCR